MTKNKIIKYTLGLLILAEILSFVTYIYPILGPWIFGLVSVAIIIASVYKLEYGLMALFAELIIGSLGKMLVLELNGVDITIRMLIWLVVLCVWLARVIKDRRITFLKSNLFKAYALFGIIIIWGAIFGIFRGNGLGAIFSDINNYLFFLLIFPIFGVLRSKKILRRLFEVIGASLVWLSVKTIVLFYIFSHEFFIAQDYLYAWSRQTRLAEITNIDPTILTSRIFMQSHIWLMFAIFLFFGLLVHICTQSNKKRDDIPFDDKNQNRIKPYRAGFIILSIVLFTTAIITSFSRSFWLAGILTFGVMIIAMFFVLKKELTKIFKFSFISIVIFVLSVGFTLLVANFPIPPGEMSASFLKDRAAKFSEEAAVSSRYAQIRPLFKGIAKHPILGSGFGTSITYESQDPRVLKNNPDGKYTTTAFELGWLEIWLKIGLIGVLAYLFIIFKIFQLGIKRINYFSDNTIAKYYIFGGLLGLVVILLTHGISPYLNHPLGIGVVMLMSAVVDRKI